MKKIKLLLVFILALALALSLISCGGGEACEHRDADDDKLCDKCGEAFDDGEEQTGGNEGGSEDDDTGIELIAKKKAKFQIVTADDITSEASELIDSYVKKLSKTYGITVRVVGDATANILDCEVLVGDVKTRGDKYSYDKYTLGKEGYAITSLDEKVMLTGGSEEALNTAIDKFFTDIIGVKAENTSIASLTFKKADEIVKIQDNYRIKDVTVGGESVKGYTIVVDASVKESFEEPVMKVAAKLQDFFYESVGAYLDIADAESFKGENAIIIRGVAVGQAGTGGFRTKVDGKSYIIECAHSNKLELAFDTYYNKNLAYARDEVLTLKKYDTDLDLTKVYYSDFGAKGDGVTNDYEAIKAAHDFANEGGQTVYASAGKTYLLKNITKAIAIKTDTNWMHAKIIFDDSNVTSANNTNVAGILDVSYDNGIIRVEQDIPDFHVGMDIIKRINDSKGDKELLYQGLESKGELTTNIGYAPGFDAVLRVYNSHHKNYLRFGYVDVTGGSQCELVLVDKDGNIDPSTPLLHDYTEITDIIVHRADTTPITIKDAVIESIASRINISPTYYYINRGISVNRANVTLENIEHIISGEIPKNAMVVEDADGLSVLAGANDKGAKPFLGHCYNGFIAVNNTHNTLIKGCTLQSRVYYLQGTYDIGATMTNKMVFEDCVQSNFFEADGSVNMSRCWGISGTNYCKNMEYINCKLTRYDAHAGVTNGKIIGGELAVLRLIGGGDFIMEGVKVWSCNSVAFQLREDYGASFNGTVTIKDVDIVDPSGNGNVSVSAILSIPATYWDMGYKTFMPNIIIDNLDIETKQTQVYLTPKSSSYREIYTKNPADPTTAGYIFKYDTRSPDKWIEKNITKEGSRFYGCKYEVKNNGSYSTVSVTDTKNQYPYYAPDFIKIVNNDNKPYKIAIINCPFFEDTEIDASNKCYVRVAP